MLKNINRLQLLSYFFIFLFTAVFIKLGYVSLQGYFVGKSNGNYSKNGIRYDITDRNGVALALNVPISSVYLHPYQIKNKSLAITAMVDSLGLNTEEATRLVNSTSKFIWVKRNISKLQEEKLKYYGVIGLHFAKEQKRLYPYGNMFAHIVGLTDTELNGIAGMELALNNQLYKNPVALSVDVKLQTILYEALQNAKQKNQAKRAYGMIVNPSTGEVLASVSLPDFNPNTREGLNDETGFNYTTQAVLELGSIIKVFSVAMGLDSKTTRLTDTFDVSKPIVANPFVIADFSHINREIILPEVILFSSNIATSLIVRKLGVANHRAYLEHFKFFTPTSLEIPEKENSLQPVKWNDLTSMIMSYGYGFAITQAHYMNAFISIVDNGIYKPLTLLKRNNNNFKSVRVISQQAAKQTKAMLRLNVAFGSGRRSDLQGYGVAGKTGSSDKLVNGRYNRDYTVASFAAFFPYNQPKYAIVISIDEPKRNAYNNYVITGGYLAAPVMAEVIEKIGVAESIPKDYKDLDGVSRADHFSLLNYVNNQSKSGNSK